MQYDEWDAFQSRKKMQREFPPIPGQEPEPRQDEFHDLQEFMDRQQWQGGQVDWELPGGGNTLKLDEDKD